jgi:molybdopterin converting factor small subunit
MLQALAFATVGAAVAVLSSGVFSSASTPAQTGESGRTASLVSTASTPTASVSGSTAQVKVVYFQMPNALSVKQEYYVVQSPATYGRLLSDAIERHPVLAGMMSNMMVLVDGVPARPDTPLSDGDEVDFIPTMSGG